MREAVARFNEMSWLEGSFDKNGLPLLILLSIGGADDLCLTRNWRNFELRYRDLDAG